MPKSRRLGFSRISVIGHSREMREVQGGCLALHWEAPVLPALSVDSRGRELFDLTLEHDLEGIVAKRLDDPYERRTTWLKIKNPDYSQKEGRGELLNLRR